MRFWLYLVLAGIALIALSQEQPCETPWEYLIQSNCPFGSAVIDGECRIVCPLVYHDPSGASISYAFACGEDADCDCSERGERTLDCRCVSGACVSVEA